MLDGIKGFLEIGDTEMAEKMLNLIPAVRDDWFPPYVFGEDGTSTV